MNRTIISIIGVAIAVVAIGIIFTSVNDLIYNKKYKETDIGEVHANPVGDNLTISWRTGKATDGSVSYRDATKSGVARDYGLSEVHRVVIHNVSGMVRFNVTSCSLEGVCDRYQGNITT